MILLSKLKKISFCISISIMSFSTSSATLISKEWKIHHHSILHSLSKPSANEQHPLSLILLNSPSLSWTWIDRLWDASILKICADGSANRLYALSQAHQDHNTLYIPDYIKGDLDSLDPVIGDYYKSKGTEIIKDSDQNSNDLEKCLHLAKSVLPAPSITTVVILGAFGGRVDHVLSGFHALKQFKDSFHEVILMDDTNLAVLLDAGHHHRIHIHPTLLGLSIGLVPVFGQVHHITTRGLHWDLHDDKLEFGQLISTSNRLSSINDDHSSNVSSSAEVEEEVDGRSSSIIDHDCVVEVETDTDVLWTCELHA